MQVLNVMKDLETLGTSAGCALLSIGAVTMDEFDVHVEQGFYVAIQVPEWDVAGLTAEGLRKDQGTIDWWKQQSAEAQKVLTDPNAVPLARALDMFDAWFGLTPLALVWGNGADFDLPILQAAYTALGRSAPWKPYNGRCYRTVKSQFRDIKLPRTGTHHNALDDAISQARHLRQICSQRGWKLA